jgi:20S proteasome alpha/beta subunit
MMKPFPKPRSFKRCEVKHMTVCVAALAADFQAVVCISDKALSYGDYIQWDSDSSKIVKINPSGTLLLFSGGEESSSKVLGKFIGHGKELWRKERNGIIQTCEEQYVAAVNALVDAKFLRPRLLDRKQYLNAITAATANDIMRALADEVKAFDMQCDLLVCGFDNFDEPFILSLGHPGIAMDMTITGHHAIGSGSEKAISRLLFSEHKRVHSVGRTLYDLFDAKANAEMAVGVGYEWDAVVILKNGYHDVTQEIKELIEQVWGRFNRSPFERYDRKEHPLPPPRDWQGKLDSLIAALVEKPTNPNTRE